MKKLLKLIALIGFCSFFFTGCPNTPESNDGFLITVGQLANSSGYVWYQPRFDEYIPDAAIIAQIRQKFDPAAIKFYIFTKPSCTCEEPQKYFPYFMKVLYNAGISDTCCEIYSMKNAQSTEPYMKILNINSIPAIFTVRDSIPSYSIMDTLNNIVHVSPDSAVVIEQLLLNSLK